MFLLRYQSGKGERARARQQEKEATPTELAIHDIAYAGQNLMVSALGFPHRPTTDSYAL
jgi:hypothetical protein